MLTDRQVRAAAAAERDYKLADGQGLHLLVTKGGAKLWRYRYAYGGKEKMISFDRLHFRMQAARSNYTFEGETVEVPLVDPRFPDPSASRSRR